MVIEKIILNQEQYILNTKNWLNSASCRYDTVGDIGHNLFIRNEDYTSITKTLEKHAYIESYCELSESGNFEGYTMWLTYYKSILLTETEILNDIKTILTILEPYHFIYVDSFFIMTANGEYFNAFCD
jgi:hypothetical protein